MTKKVGRTVPAVNTGCQAGSFCCLNAESTNNCSLNVHQTNYKRSVLKKDNKR